MKYFWLSLLLSLPCVAAASPDSLRVSPGLLRRLFASPGDSVDYFRTAAVTFARFEYFSDQSFFLLGADTVLHPENLDELLVGYADIAAATDAYRQLYEHAGQVWSDLYRAFQSGAFIGRSGSWIVVRWIRHDTGRYDATPARRYFRSRQFDESFEIYRTRRKLK